MSWEDNWNTAKCDVCGKFISFKDLDDGKAIHILVTPDSEFTSETYESLCKDHIDDRLHYGTLLFQDL